ncbi:hypothetical protein AOLI_G00141750 [Acnodon oligacanthus]
MELNEKELSDCLQLFQEAIATLHRGIIPPIPKLQHHNKTVNTSASSSNHRCRAQRKVNGHSSFSWDLLRNSLRTSFCENPGIHHCLLMWDLLLVRTETRERKRDEPREMRNCRLI